MARGLAFGWFVTVSRPVTSASDGYRYLLTSVATGDGQRDLFTPLTCYYAEAGCPLARPLDALTPGSSRWLAAEKCALSEARLVG